MKTKIREFFVIVTCRNHYGNRDTREMRVADFKVLRTRNGCFLAKGLESLAGQPRGSMYRAIVLSRLYEYSDSLKLRAILYISRLSTFYLHSSAILKTV